MTKETTYKFQLDTSSKKIVCAGCGQRRAVRYLNIETNEFLPDMVSRCDRESSCAYHYTPKQYLTDTGQGYIPTVINKVQTIEALTDFMPMDFVEKSMSGFYETNFAIWLRSLFGVSIANAALKKYLVGRSKNDQGRACIFWRIDKIGKVRTGKIMCYDHLTGRRKKAVFPTWVHSDKKMQPFNFQLCFFGEHLLTLHPEKTIGITESEKSAVVASLFMPDMIWIASGGNSGCKWREWSVFNVLKDRDIILFPDFGYFNKKTGKTCFQEWSDRAKAIQDRMNCNMKVSQVLEDILPAEQRTNDYDLADMLIKTEKPGGLAMAEIQGYPAVWDMKFNSFDQ